MYRYKRKPSGDFCSISIVVLCLLVQCQPMVRAVAENADHANKLGLLTNCLPKLILSSSMPPLIKELEIRSQIISERIIVFARHLLMTRTQSPTKTIEELVHALRQLARDCEFQNVNAENSKNEMTRDAFINGINSSEIADQNW